jgi:hypothetical protein
LFNDLRTIEGVEFPTYQEACNELGLLVNDYLYDQTLTKASFVRSGFKLCQLFAMMCVHTPLSSPVTLLKSHFEAMSDDMC